MCSRKDKRLQLRYRIVRYEYNLSTNRIEEVTFRSQILTQLDFLKAVSLPSPPYLDCHCA
jgi:hypothetical protein